MLSSLLKPPWLRIRLRLCLITLTKPSHGPSKPVDDPREVRATKLWSHRLKDADAHILEVGVTRCVPRVELLKGVANLAYDMFQLLHGQFSRYRRYDALCQLREFGLHVTP